MAFGQRTAVVTGVASGIGAATARKIAGDGFQVIGIDQTPPSGQTSLARFIRCDLSDPASIEAAAASLQERLSGVVNVAGVSSAAPYELQLRVNFLGARHLTQHLTPLFGPTVSVVSVASGTAMHWRDRFGLFRELAATNSFADGLAWLAANPQTGPFSYGRSKEMLVAWTQVMAAQAAGTGIRYNTISPGPVSTRMLDEFRSAIGAAIIEADIARSSRAGTVDEIADVIAFMLGDGSAWINGADLPVDGGFAASALLDDAKWPPDPA